MKMLGLNVRTPLTFVLASAALVLGACAVDFDGYAFDDEKLAEAEGNGDGDGDETPPASEECLAFCSDQEELCGFDESSPYPSNNECLTLCMGYFPIELSCRITHLGYARTAPVTHCPHTSENGAGTCDNAEEFSCDRFCLRTGEACPFDEGEEGVYANRGACDDACADFTDNGLECRFVELGVAESGDDSSCAELLPEGTKCPMD